MSWISRISPCLRPSSLGEGSRTYTNEADTSPGWTEPLRMVYDHELVLFMRGDYLVELEGEEIRCPEGCFLIIPPGKWHVTYHVGGAGGHRCWSHFDWMPEEGYETAPLMTFFPDSPRLDLVRRAPEHVPAGVLHGQISELDTVRSLFARLVAFSRTGGTHALLRGRAVLLELLTVLCDTGRSPVPEPGRHVPRIVENIRRLLDDVAARPGPIPSLPPLLEASGRSYAHLCRLFRKEYGLPPLRYVHTMRISRAKLLLREGDLGVGEVAYRLGYDSPSYFCQVFKKLTGMVPSAFAKGRSGATTIG